MRGNPRGYWIVVKVEAYHYFRKFKGRKRRTRIDVPAFEYRRWIKPRPKPKHPRPKTPPKGLGAKTPPGSRPKPKHPKPAAPVKAAGRKEWLRVEDFLSALEFEAEKIDFHFEISNKVENYAQATDWVSPVGFVWPKPLAVPVRPIYANDFVVMVAVWALVQNHKAKKWFLWCRTRTFGLPGRKNYGLAVDNIEAVAKHRTLAYRALLKQIAKAEYVEAIEPPAALQCDPNYPIAWTFWIAGKKRRKGEVYKKLKRFTHKTKRKKK